MSPRSADADGVVRLPADLVGPVEVELARAVEAIPPESALPGGCRYTSRSGTAIFTELGNPY
ncbi:hypothetical protein AB0E69_17130 [Kribbella sp. NPDC026611]|uniref:hypothetical protein n=1 Tax=Kribbella sp. NPDC026611 TaxID=3154911 RepID=UPI0033FF698C